MRRLNLAGKQFGLLVVLKEEGQKVWVKCECGALKVVLRSNLIAGYTKSCGCFQKQRTSSINGTHLSSRTQLYSVWKAMKARCYNTNKRSYKWYGGKGIGVCERWHDFSNFQLDMQGEYKPGLTLDRIDSSKDYSPENCRWLTKSENSRRRHVSEV